MYEFLEEMKIEEVITSKIEKLEEKGFNEGKEKQIKERMAHIGYHKFEGMYDRFSYLDAVVIEDSKK